MTYKEILNKFESQDLKKEFCEKFYPLMTDSFKERLNITYKIHSPGSLIRTVLPLVINEDKKIYDRWVIILQWYMYPEFARPKKIIDWIIEK